MAGEPELERLRRLSGDMDPATLADRLEGVRARKARAIKYDTDKPRLDLVPVGLILAAGRALGFGADKYADYNYLRGDGLKHGRIFAALQRHLWAYWSGEDLDPESDHHHLDHAAACLGMLIDLVEKRPQGDDRPPGK